MTTYVATVHWQNPHWVKPQVRQIRRHLPPDTEIFAAVRGRGSDLEAFDHAENLDGTHAEKLDQLAAIILRQASDEDLLVFVDSDAFPLRRVDGRLLRGMPLAAVRRDENLGDPQPHPCFALTTVGFWRRMGADWGRGPSWVNSRGETVSDPGACLWKLLGDEGITWRPLLRSNRRNFHPLWFGVYDDLVYHHGAGSRRFVSRVDLNVVGLRIDRSVRPGPFERQRLAVANQRLRARRIAAELTSRLLLMVIRRDPQNLLGLLGNGNTT